MGVVRREKKNNGTVIAIKEVGVSTVDDPRSSRPSLELPNK